MATGPWTDPKESRPERWSGPRDPARVGDHTRSVVERALATAPPYRRRGTVARSGASLRESFRTREYDHARVDFDATLSADGAIRLLVKGHLWGRDERDQRYRVQHRRPAAPTGTLPFDEYETWVRYQFGRVERADGGAAVAADGDPSFVPDPAVRDETRTLAWDDLFPLHRRLLAELEAVRNPAFAEYRLRELGEWADVRDDLKWDLDAFAVGP
ncbi:hypothetical protein [Halobaculum lipolyticum]|uniref:Uncharacterized protein n=1 Tax=Halobaculum lipolyticum TaxID=3032001 RepID=A0ABD5WAJ8_9EURY|nr:hypothetical protein [Halobaculum sp. DT31]